MINSMVGGDHRNEIKDRTAVRLERIIWIRDLLKIVVLARHHARICLPDSFFRRVGIDGVFSGRPMIAPRRPVLDFRTLRARAVVRHFL